MELNPAELGDMQLDLALDAPAVASCEDCHLTDDTDRYVIGGVPRRLCHECVGWYAVGGQHGSSRS